MASSAQNNCNVGRAVAYTVYSVGASVLVGLARVIVAIAYIVKHALNASVAVNAQQIAKGIDDAARSKDINKLADNEERRDREDIAAERKRKKAKGVWDTLLHF